MKNKPKDIKIKQNIQKAAQILTDLGIQKINVGNFGIYRQYEVAGEKIKFEVEYDEWTDDMEEETAEQVGELLRFLKPTYIHKTLRFPDEGQNTLIFHNDGTFTYKTFSL